MASRARPAASCARLPVKDCSGILRCICSQRLLALQPRLERGKACRLCPCSSDVDLFGYGESVIDLNAEIAHCALDLFVPQ